MTDRQSELFSRTDIAISPDLVKATAPPKRTPAQTSAAARQHVVDSGSAAHQKSRVLEFLRGRGDHGATDEEIQIGLGISSKSEPGRRLELQRDGLVESTGRTRPTTSGHAATVWRAKS